MPSSDSGLLQGISRGGIRVVVDDLEVVLVEARAQVRLSQSQPDRVGNALTERACARTATLLLPSASVRSRANFV